MKSMQAIPSFAFIIVLHAITTLGVNLTLAADNAREDLHATAVGANTLNGKVMCGYQGWFACEGDGSDLGWRHWSRGRKDAPGPGNVKVDLWPDVSELGPDERFETAFKHADGQPAQVFSSFKRKTVLRHFKWMRDYGIDGVFVQRFASGLRITQVRRHTNTVLNHCRDGAAMFGRAYAVMYDLSGLSAGRIGDVIDDWRELHTQMRIADDARYLRHRGKPIVAVWGLGFNDGRAYTLSECRRLLVALKGDPIVGECAVMVGVPTGWRELRNYLKSQISIDAVV